MITERRIDPQTYMRLHRNRLHNDYHNFKTALNDIIANGQEPDDLFQKAQILIKTIQACAQNGHKYGVAQRKKAMMDNSSPIVIRTYKSGELLFPKSIST